MNSSGIISPPLLVAALMAIVIAGAGGLFIYANQQDENVEPKTTASSATPAEPTAVVETTIAQPTPAPAKITSAPQPAAKPDDSKRDWAVYRNAGQKVTFRYPYPQGTEIVEDGIYKTDFPRWYRVGLRFPSEIGIPPKDLPYLTFEVNPEGYGPIFADEIYAIAEAPDGTIKIVSEKKVDYSTSEQNYGDDGTRMIVVSSFQHSNGNTYYWRFAVPEKDGDRYEPLFKEILGTFTFER